MIVLGKSKMSAVRAARKCLSDRIEFGWLMSSAQEQFIERLLEATRALQVITVRAIAAANNEVTVPQFEAMSKLSERDWHTMGELAVRLDAHPSTITRMCERLEAKDLVFRSLGRVSRREVEIALTDNGRDLVRKVIRKRRGEVGALIGSLEPRWREGVIAGLQDFAERASGLRRSTATCRAESRFSNDGGSCFQSHGMTHSASSISPAASASSSSPRTTVALCDGATRPTSFVSSYQRRLLTRATSARPALVSETMIWRLSLLSACRSMSPFAARRSASRVRVDGFVSSATASAAQGCLPRWDSTTSARYCGTVMSPRSPIERAATATSARDASMAAATVRVSACVSPCSVAEGFGSAEGVTAALIACLQ